MSDLLPNHLVTYLKELEKKHDEAADKLERRLLEHAYDPRVAGDRVYGYPVIRRA